MKWDYQKVCSAFYTSKIIRPTYQCSHSALFFQSGWNKIPLGMQQERAYPSDSNYRLYKQHHTIFQLVQVRWSHLCTSNQQYIFGMGETVLCWGSTIQPHKECNQRHFEDLSRFQTCLGDRKNEYLNLEVLGQSENT